MEVDSRLDTEPGPHALTDEEARAPLRFRLVLREAVETGRGRFWAVLIPAIVIFVPLTLLDTWGEHLAAQGEGDTGWAGVVVETVSLAGASGLLFGWVVFTGLLDAVVGSHQFGHENLPLPQRLRRLPVGRLVLATMLVSLLVVLGISLLVIPGLVVLTLLGITGPLMVSERLGVVAALGRSARLVRPHLRVAFAAIALPFLAEQLIEDGMLAIWPSNIWASALVSIALTLVVGVTGALIEVVLAYELMTRDEREGARGAATGITPTRARRQR